MIGNQYPLKRICIVMVSLIFFSKAVVSQTVTATISPSQVELGQPVEYTVTISGGNVQSFSLPDFSGKFNIVNSGKSTSYSMVNGNVSFSETRRFILVPTQKGKYLLEPAIVAINGSTFKSNTVEIRVISSNSSSSAPTHLSSQNKDPIFAQVKLSKNTVYQGEALVYDMTLYRRIQLFGNVGFEIPDFSGFWAKEMPADQQDRNVVVNGQNHLARTLVKRLLFPINTGILTIKSARIGFVLNPFEGNRVILAPEQKITVKPLPEQGKPNDFSGIVGNFRIQTQLKSNSFIQDTPIYLSIFIKGEGNLAPLKEFFVPDSQTFKAYVAQVTDLKTEGLSQEKKLDYVIIPRASGKINIPEFLFSFFNPSTKQYQTLKTPPLSLDILAKLNPSVNSQKKLFQEDTSSLKPISSLNQPQFWQSPWMLAPAFFLVLLTLFLLFSRLNISIPKPLKHLLEKNQDFKKIQKLRDNPQQLQPLQDVLLKTISQKINAPCQGKTKEALSQQLQDAHFPHALIQDILSFLDDLAFSLYAPQNISLQDKQALCDRGLRLILDVKKLNLK